MKYIPSSKWEKVASQIISTQQIDVLDLSFSSLALRTSGNSSTSKLRPRPPNPNPASLHPHFLPTHTRQTSRGGGQKKTKTKKTPEVPINCLGPLGCLSLKIGPMEWRLVEGQDFQLRGRPAELPSLRVLGRAQHCGCCSSYRLSFHIGRSLRTHFPVLLCR